MKTRIPSISFVFLFIFSLLSIVPAWAQELMAVKGNVLNAETYEPIPMHRLRL